MAAARRLTRLVAVVASAGALAPTAEGCAPRLPPPPAAHWEYTVDPPAHGSRELSVEAEFVASGTDVLSIDGVPSRVLRDVEVDGGSGWHAPVHEGTWRDPACRRRCAVRYHVDLGKLAAACDDAVDCAMRVGDATLSPAMAWLLHPEPNGDADVVVHVRPAAPLEFLTGMAPRPDAGFTYGFRSPDLDEGAFTAMGPMRRTELSVRGATIDVALLGEPMVMSDAQVFGWIADSAAVASSLYPRFPVPHAAVFVVPVPDEDEVAFGKVLSLSGASVALLVGAKMPAAEARKDWVLVHELFHLGFPSFRGEGRWLEEGLAVYYALVLRHRAGWLTEEELWAELARKLPRGLPSREGEGLLYERDLDAMYWGGALFALLADVRLLQVTKGRSSLDSALRAMAAAGANATHVWHVADVLREGDAATGTDVLHEMYVHHAVRGDPVDLPALLDSLGVERAVERGPVHSVTLRDDRPLSAVRRAISAGH